MLLYTLVFTLVNSPPEKNKYIDMFYIWLSYIIKNSELNEEDKVIVFIDQLSLDFLNSNESLSVLAENIPFNLEFFSIQQPTSVQEGILERYAVERVQSSLTLFLDVDVVVLQSLKKLPPIPPNTLIVMPEGKLLGDNYAFDLLEKNKETENCCGFTAGWFLFSYGKGIQDFFSTVAKDYIENSSNKKYTEQSFFNKHVFLTKWKQTLQLTIEFINSNTMPNNEYKYSNELFMNYCGDVGNASMHFSKLLTMLCLDFIKAGVK